MVLKNSKTDKSVTKIENGTQQKTDSADFEKAVSETGFGRFNLLLVLITVPSVFASQFEVSSLSYVFPTARCDLDLSLENQGMINAVIYAGMIGSSFLWGSLVDVYGRRKMLMLSHICDFFFSLLATFTPNIYFLLCAKFFGGFFINGCTMALAPYLSEFHAIKYRSRVPLTLGLLYNVGNIVLPLMAWLILPLNPNLKIGEFEFHGWNLFLCLCSIPTLLSGLLFFLMPETPKYLITKGQNEEALQVFRKIYRMNTGQNKNSYPVMKLTDDKQIHHKKLTMKEAWKQITPLFSAQYVYKLILVCLMMGFLMMCTNSLRLFLPQIFQVLNDFEGESKSKSFCEILNTMSTNNNTEKACFVNFDNSSVYTNSMYVATTAVVGYIVAGFIVNKIGKKKILILCQISSAATVASIYLAPNVTAGVVLICAYMALIGICVDVLITIIVDLFPTSLRASALSLALMLGRMGSVFGNLLLPVLIQTGCATQFFTLAAVILCCTLVSIFLPNTDNIALK